MAVNLDIKLDIVEAKDASYIYIKDNTGTCNNENGFQDAGASCNIHNPAQSEVDTVVLNFSGGGLTGNQITLTPEQIADFFDQDKGIKLTATSIFGSTVAKYPYGAYEIGVSYSGTSSVATGSPLEFVEGELKYHALIEPLVSIIRGYSVSVAMPPENTSEWFNTTINLGVLNFMLDDVKYACELGYKEKADEIINAIDTIVSKGGQIMEFTTF